MLISFIAVQKRLVFTTVDWQILPHLQRWDNGIRCEMLRIHHAGATNHAANQSVPLMSVFCPVSQTICSCHFLCVYLSVCLSSHVSLGLSVPLSFSLPVPSLYLYCLQANIHQPSPCLCLPVSVFVRVLPSSVYWVSSVVFVSPSLLLIGSFSEFVF